MSAIVHVPTDVHYQIIGAIEKHARDLRASGPAICICIWGDVDHVLARRSMISSQLELLLAKHLLRGFFRFVIIMDRHFPVGIVGFSRGVSSPAS